LNIIKSLVRDFYWTHEIFFRVGKRFFENSFSLKIII
jgi:hypothetical protein